MTQVDVGQKLGLSKSAVSYYETGERDLSASLIHKFCDLYGVTADYLLCRSSNPHPTVSNSDTALLAAYHAAPLEIRKIIDTALAPYLPAEESKTAAS